MLTCKEKKVKLLMLYSICTILIYKEMAGTKQTYSTENGHALALNLMTGSILDLQMFVFSLRLLQILSEFDNTRIFS